MLIPTLIIAAAGVAGETPERATAGENPRVQLEARVESVRFGATRFFAAPEPYPKEEGQEGADLMPQVSVWPVEGLPILGSQVDVRITRLTDEAGKELRRTTPAARPEEDDGPTRGWRTSAYLFRGGVGDGYSSEMSAYMWGVEGRTRVLLDELPVRIGALEGEADVDVVTEDAMPEREIGARRKTEVIAPGVEVSVVPPRGVGLRQWGQALEVVAISRSMATYGMSGRTPLGAEGVLGGRGPLVESLSGTGNPLWMDGAPGRVSYRTFAITDDRGERVVPVVNIMRISSMDVTGSPTQFRTTKHPDGTMTGEAALHAQMMMARPAFGLRAHIVYRTERVAMPFRIENVQIRGSSEGARASNAAAGGEEPRRDLAVRAEGYELRLLNLRAGGSRRFGIDAPDFPSSFELGIGLMRIEGTAVFGGTSAVRIHAFTDGDGRPVEQTGQMIHTGRLAVMGGSEAEYTPRPALRFEEKEKSESDARGTGGAGGAGPQVYVSRRSIERIPARIGVLRGEFSFYEATDETVLDIPLRPGAMQLEIVPGVFLIGRAEWMHGVRDEKLVGPPGPSMMQYELNMPAQEKSFTVPQIPALNMTQFTRGGQVLPPVKMGRVRANYQDGRRVESLGSFPFATSPSAVRLHIILDARQRVIPFEFKDLPCGSP